MAGRETSRERNESKRRPQERKRIGRGSDADYKEVQHGNEEMLQRTGSSENPRSRQGGRSGTDAGNAFRWVTVGGKYRISRRSFDSWLDDALGETEEVVPKAVGMGVASAGGDAAGMGVTPVGAEVAAAQPAVWVI